MPSGFFGGDTLTMSPGQSGGGTTAFPSTQGAMDPALLAMLLKQYQQQQGLQPNQQPQLPPQGSTQNNPLFAGNPLQGAMNKAQNSLLPMAPSGMPGGGTNQQLIQMLQSMGMWPVPSGAQSQGMQ